VGQFAYRLLKDGRVFVSHRDRHVVTLTDPRAAAFRAALEEDGCDEQLLMARVTGNFKRGNERVARQRSRRD
jgi:hypothetical protein